MMLFGGKSYYAEGGADDFICYVKTIRQAQATVIALVSKRKLYDPSDCWAHVCDSRFRVLRKWHIGREMGEPYTSPMNVYVCWNSSAARTLVWHGATA